MALLWAAVAEPCQEPLGLSEASTPKSYPTASTLDRVGSRVQRKPAGKESSPQQWKVGLLSVPSRSRMKGFGAETPC